MAASASAKASALCAKALGTCSHQARPHKSHGTGARTTPFLRQKSCNHAKLLEDNYFLGGLSSSNVIRPQNPGTQQSAPKVCQHTGSRKVAVQAATAGGSTKVSKIEDPVLVVGATGGVGQIVVSYLLDRGYKVRAVLRNKEKAEQIFGHDHDDQLQLFVADTRYPDTLRPEIFEGVASVICCTGTTAFPSKRWDGGKPEETDYHGFKNLLEKTPKSIKKFVLVSSVGVESYNSFPYNILNLFGVLKWKKLGEELLQKAGHPFTIIRAGRLMDGPYTSFDLNTLLKTASGTRRAVIVSKGDKLRGEASRLSVAEACLQALQLESTNGHIYEINSAEGDGPGTDPERWAALFSGAERVGQAKS